MRHLVFTRVDGRPVVVRRRRGGEKRARGEVGHMSFGSYTTHKQVVIRSWRLGALYHALVGCVVAYVVCYLVYAERGYQMRSTANGNIGVKVKGQGVMRDVVTGRATVYDANDVVTYEPSGFFVATAVATTLQAREGRARDRMRRKCARRMRMCAWRGW